MECNLCKESLLNVGDRTDYGAVIVCKVGDSNDGWFATLSPKTGGDPNKDFSIQLMPSKHLTHFSEMEFELARNYGVAFGKVNKAMTQVMSGGEMESESELREDAISVATYGKATNWKEKKEHLHIKVFPFRGNIGQPYTVDSSFGRKEIHKDNKGEFVKMNPVRKVMIDERRFEELAKQFIDLLK